jgi:hypothetical protein
MIPCPVLLDPSCLIIQGAGVVASQAAGSAASGALGGIASAIQSGVAWIVASTIDWWIKIPSPDLAAEPAVGQLQQLMLPVTASVAVLGLIIAGGKMALTRKASPLIDVAGGLVTIGATTAIGVLLPTLLLQAGDAWSSWALNASTGGQFGARMTSVLSLTGAQPAVVVVLGIAAIIITAMQAVLMLFRQASLVVLAGVLPLAATGTLNRATRPWFPKVGGWMFALIFYKPAAAGVDAVAFLMIGTGRDARTVFMGIAMMGMSLLALPVLMRFFTWTTGQVTETAGGGGFLQTALSGAVAFGSLRGSAGGAGGSGPADQARLVSDRLGPADGGPSGAQPAAGGARQAAAPSPQGTGQAAFAGMPAGATAAASGAGTAGGGAAAASGAASAAGGPAGFAATAVAQGAQAAGRKAAEAMQPPAGSSGGQ